jgi:hypothetical protein
VNPSGASKDAPPGFGIRVMRVARKAGIYIRSRQAKMIRLAISFLIIASFSATAEQTVINDYDGARDNYFDDQLYIGNTGESLYYGIARPIFDNVGKHRILEHVMPADWMAEHFGCPNRNDCNNTTYKHAEGDLHNLWLAVKNINSSRSDRLFGDTDQ